MTQDKVYIELEAFNIISKHTANFMAGCDYNPDDIYDLYNTMIEECSAELTYGLLHKKYTPMQYNDLRNKIASLLWDTFQDHI